MQAKDGTLQKNIAAASRPTTAVNATGGLIVLRTDEAERIVLHTEGVVDMTTLLVLRDAAFTAIGARPRVLCLDLTPARGQLDIAAINTLVTIGRVARLVDVHLTVRVRAELEETLRITGLIRALPLDPGA